MKYEIQLDNGKEYTLTVNGLSELARRVAQLNHITAINSSVTFSELGLSVFMIKYRYRKGDKEKRAVTHVRILKVLEDQHA